MLTKYLDTAMHRAICEQLEDDDGCFATIPDFPRIVGERQAL